LLGAQVAGFDKNYVVGGNWSHDSQHFCFLTFRGAFVESNDETDGGVHMPVPLDKDTFPLDCMWSHDDALVAWRYQGPTSVYVTPVDGSSAIEVAHAPVGTFDGQLNGWSPIESRLSFGLEATGGGAWQIFTALATGGTPIEIDDVAGTVVEWTSDGRSIAYIGTHAGPDFETLRLAPVLGPMSAGVDLAPTTGYLSGFVTTLDTEWIAYVIGAGSLSETLMVTSTRSASYPVTTGSFDNLTWSSTNRLAFVVLDDASSGRAVTVLDPVSGVTMSIGAAVLGESIDGAAWSPDGSQLAYVRAMKSASTARICVAAIAPTSFSERCTSPSSDYGGGAIWSSDGAYLAFGGSSPFVMAVSDLVPHAVPVTDVRAQWWVRP
jgi:hypothetical protein